MNSAIPFFFLENGKLQQRLEWLFCFLFPLQTEDSLVELPPGLDISRIRLSDSAPDTSRDCSQPPGLGHAGGGNCASESEQCVSDETERELGEPEQAQSASNVDIACSEIEYSDEKEDGPPIATAVPVAKVEEEDEDEEEEEDWETALETGRL